MQPSTRSFLYLLSSLCLGLLLGVVGTVAYLGLPPNGPPDGPPDGPREGGFMAHMEATIEPRDSAQRAAVRSVLEVIDARNRAAVGESQRSMRDNLTQMVAALDTLLDSAQRARVDALVRKLREGAPPPRGGPPAGGPPREGPPGGRPGGPPPQRPPSH